MKKLMLGLSIFAFIGFSGMSMAEQLDKPTVLNKTQMQLTSEDMTENDEQSQSVNTEGGDQNTAADQTDDQTERQENDTTQVPTQEEQPMMQNSDEDNEWQMEDDGSSYE